MSKIKPTLPKGMRDFGPQEVFKRRYIINAVKQTFEKFGFLPLETPTMENLSVLTGKYGEEGDQLLFKVLNSGDFLSKTKQEDIDGGASKILPKISEKGLRYDLTIPFARFVTMNQNDIAFPFKRYQIQPVWRADRPQKGRYREFYQCDADVIGSDSLLSEAEIIMMIQDVFGKLRIKDYTVKINNRKILQAIVDQIGESENFIAITVAIDKLDKIGVEGVVKELSNNGISEKAKEQLKAILSKDFADFNSAILFLETYFTGNELGKEGVDELKTVFDYVQKSSNSIGNVQLDVTLARGLNYYTGCIFEVVVNNVKIGSVSGGGRYDNLTESFGLPNMSGVGFSFGLDRIYDVMSELDLFPKGVNTSTEILIIPFDNDSFEYGLTILKKLRSVDIKSELYPDIVKIKKSMKYANDKQIPNVILIGEDELKSGNLTFKNMINGEQETLTIKDIIIQFTLLN